MHPSITRICKNHKRYGQKIRRGPMRKVLWKWWVGSDRPHWWGLAGIWVLSVGFMSASTGVGESQTKRKPCSPGVTLPTEASSNTGGIQSPIAGNRVWPALKWSQVSTQWHILTRWADAGQFPRPAWTCTQMAKDHMCNMDKHMYASTPST